MSGRKNLAIWITSILAVSLVSASLSACFLSGSYRRMHFQALGGFCKEIMEVQPEVEQAVLSVLKRYHYWQQDSDEENILIKYGYRQSDFLGNVESYGRFCIFAGFSAGVSLFFVIWLLWRKRECARIKALTDYLERVNTRSGGVFFQAEEDEFSGLQDEIYKTVTFLYQTREAAIAAKSNFAENLSNIAHQIKTSLTSILLSVQMMRETAGSGHLEQIEKQLSRLTHLEEALLLLSRIDAGTLSLERQETDVYTLLMLAADNLQELFVRGGISVQIPEAGEAVICVDREWTMEAFMNLLKNCMEHTVPGGNVYCCYEQNPLYTQIRIWDVGSGFAKEDLPHLFDRFYRGKNAVNGGIGIGLALSKAIIEDQNGTIRAENLPDGGACFEVRFYSH